jgi:large subunit ribosomal protein L24
VQVVTGADRGKQGRVISVRRDGQVRIEKVRLQKKHLKPGSNKDARAGGIIEQEGYINPSNVMLVDPTDNKPSRTLIKIEDGRRVRIFARSGDAVPEAAGS